MSYVERVLQPGEKVLIVGHLHWVMYVPGLFWLVLGVLVAVFAKALAPMSWQYYWVAPWLGLPFILYGLARLAYAKFVQWISEIAVTDRRVIQKTGFIARDTAEMNIQQVESVEVTQTVMGRLLSYGTLRIHGTGHGLEALKYVANPLAIRTAITAR